MNGRQRVSFSNVLLCAVIFASLYLPCAAATDVAKPTVDMSIYRHVVHIGWVVSDLDRVVDYWEKLGLKHVERKGVLDFPDTTYHGKQTPLSLKMAFARL